MHKVRNYYQLSKAERIVIQTLRSKNFSIADIARELGRSASTISRELARNGGSSYSASAAEKACRSRHRLKHKRVQFQDGQMRYAADLIRNGFSPELVSNQGRRLLGQFVSTERLYQWIWAMKFSQRRRDKEFQDLYRYLMHGRRKRKRGRRKNERGNILHRVYIENRPPGASNRSSRGHLEADIVLGKDRQPGLLVVLDRKTRCTWVRRLPTRDSAYVVRKLREICQKAGCKTLTMDNDQSFALHYKLHPMGVKTYFTHPYSSQEKGSVENRIGQIRRIYPKKTNFEEVTPQQVRLLENWLNNRPMRMFNYRTPNEVDALSRSLH